MQTNQSVPCALTAKHERHHLHAGVFFADDAALQAGPVHSSRSNDIRH